jgi:branched-chain amino acid transport system ATP-binding protein
MSLLEVDAINTYYGDSHILFDLSLRVEEGETLALLGRNGAGKSTTLKSVMGVLPPRSGRILFDGQSMRGLSAFEIARLGVQLVPEDRRIFADLSVEENLELAALTATHALDKREIFAHFPQLVQRRKNRGRELSGGEQQMLAVARALIRNPRLILLDEPFEGLAPVLVQELIRVIRRLAEQGRTIAIVEQNVVATLSLAHRCYILSNGHIVYEGTACQMRKSPEIMGRYLGL